MAKIIVEETALEAAAQEIEMGNFILMYVDADEDSSDDLDLCQQKFRRAAEALREIIKKSRPAKPEK